MISTKTTLLTAVGTATIAGGSAGTYYLLQDKTIEHKLIREGIALINSKDEYEVAFIERKEDTELLKLIGDTQVNDNFTKGGNALKKWCEKNLKLDLSEKNIKDTLPKAQKYCAKPSETIEERYTKLTKKLIEGDEWKTKVTDLKRVGQDSSLTTDLNLSALSEDSDNSKSSQALKDWCNKQIKVRLSQDKTETIWGKVKGRCLKP